MSTPDAATRGRRPLSYPRVVVFTSRRHSRVMRSLSDGWGVPVEFVVADDLATREIHRRLERWEPEIAACLNVTPPIDLSGRVPLGLIDIWTGLARLEKADVGEEPVALVGVARWSENGEGDRSIIAQARAPVYAADTARRVRARADELAMRLLGSSLRDALAEDGRLRWARQEPMSYRPLTAFQRLRWRFVRPRRQAAVTLGSPVYLLKAAAAIVALSLLRLIRDLVRTLRRKHPVRVFTFHRISELCRDEVTVSPDIFRRQLQYVRKHHVVVDMRRGLELLRNSAPLRKPVAILTFDDAYRSVYEFAAPAMAELDVPGCCFATTEFVGTDRRYPWDSERPVREFLPVMSWDEIRRLQDRGWTIGGHTATHPRLADCDRDKVREELSASLSALQRSLGVRDVPMAYPFGGPDDVTDETLGLVSASGYSACFSNFGGENLPPTPLFRLTRIDIGGDHRPLAWKVRVHGLDRGDLQRWLQRRGK